MSQHPTPERIFRVGFDCTGADGEGWLPDAGFSSTRIEPLVGPESMVIGVK